MTEAQRRRALRHADIPWDEKVTDPRKARGRVHPHLGILGLLMASFAVGLVTLRRAEDLGEDLGPGARRSLGLPRKVSDSTLYRMAAKQRPEGFRETLWAQVRELFKRKVVQNDLFPVGVVSLDGKGNWSSTSHDVDGAKESSCGKGAPLWMLGSLRAVLTSSMVRPCLDMELIGAKEGESPAFRTVFPRVCEQFGGRFAIVTGDAGLTCRENAALVREHDRHYLFGLKGNQPTLYAIATESPFWSPVRARSEDRAHGKTVVRELFKLGVKDDARVDMADAQQFWCVRQTSIHPAGESSTELHYFVTSLPSGRLLPSQELALVRLHWGIENGHNWTMDMMLQEDDVQPCQQSRNSIEVVGWLRLLAYNMLSAWRCRSPLKDGKPMPWKRVMEKLRDALLSLGTAESLVTIV